MTRDLERSWDKLTQMKRKVTEAIQRANISLTRARENELARIVETVRAGTLPTVSRKEERLRQEVSSKHTFC